MAGVTTLSSSTAAAPRRIEHALFTSLRSYIARGYRLVAASRGLSEDEQREIVQRAPSHANLEGADEDAEGQAVFTLRSGRVALLYSRHAGPEGSGRGGLRVHTDVLVLSPALYMHCGGTPQRVLALAGPAFAATAGGAPPAVLPPIDAPAHPTTAALVTTPPAAEQGALLAVLSAVLNRRLVLVSAARAPRVLLNAVLAVVPAALRPGLSFAWGMKPGLQRAFSVLAFRGADAEIGAFAAEHSYTVLRWPEAAARADGDCAAWLEFVAESWRNGRGNRVAQVADELTGDAQPAMLKRVAEAARSIERITTATGAALEAIAVRGEQLATAGLPAPLLERLRGGVAARRAELAGAAAEADPAAQP